MSAHRRGGFLSQRTSSKEKGIHRLLIVTVDILREIEEKNREVDYTFRPTPAYLHSYSWACRE